MNEIFQCLLYFVQKRFINWIIFSQDDAIGIDQIDQTGKPVSEHPSQFFHGVSGQRIFVLVSLYDLCIGAGFLKTGVGKFKKSFLHVTDGTVSTRVIFINTVGCVYSSAGVEIDTHMSDLTSDANLSPNHLAFDHDACAHSQTDRTECDQT